MWMDRLGSVASAACAAHCLMLAVLPSLIATLGLSVLSHEAFEWGFFALAVGFAIVSGVLAYRLHRTRWVLAGFGAGVLILLAGRLGEALALYEGGAIVAVLGGALLATSHLVSL
ncbi:unnamed protein product, partial [Ectocarpus fasciculatus]